MEQNSDRQLGWTCYEEHGYPVILLSEAEKLNKELSDDFLDEHKISKDELKVGTELAILTLLGGLSKAKVTQIGKKDGSAENEVTYYLLEYDERRKCWINACAANKKALAKVKLFDKE